MWLPFSALIDNKKAKAPTGKSRACILERRQPNVLRRLLDEWLAWACRSRLPAFVRVPRTIRNHLDDIIAYVSCYHLSNGLTEGLNNKARLAS